MTEKKTKVNVDIFGETYALKGDVEPERIKKLAALLNEKMQRIARGNPRLSPLKVAVLAGLNLADEYLRLEQDYQQLVQMLKEK